MSQDVQASIYPEDPPYVQPDGIVVDQGIPFRKDNKRSLLLDLYRPTGTAGWGMRSGWVLLFGGRWQRGSRIRLRRFAAHLAAKHGAVCVCSDYRLSGEAIYPAAVTDARAALTWLRQHAAEYGIHPERIGAGGASAGGQLAAMLGVTGPQADRARALLLFNPVLDLVQLMRGDDAETSYDWVLDFMGRPLSEAENLYAEASPMNYVDSNAPPTLIMHGTVDSEVPYEQSRRFTDLLHQSKIRANLVAFEGAEHGSYHGDPHYSAGLRAIDRFVRSLWSNT